MKKFLENTLSLGTLMTIMFLLLQVCEIIKWSVVWLLAPLWMPIAIVLAFTIIIFIFSFVAGIVAAIIERKVTKDE